MFLQLHEMTQDSKFLHRAWQFALFSLCDGMAMQHSTGPEASVVSPELVGAATQARSDSKAIDLDRVIADNDPALLRRWIGDVKANGMPELWGEPDYPFCLMNGVGGAACFFADLLDFANRERGMDHLLGFACFGDV